MTTPPAGGATPVPRARDLAEAAVWSRRRLAAALVAGEQGVSGGAPGVRRPVRLLVVGVLLTLLVTGVATGALAAGWTR